ncbi:hypothetical protein SDC9_191212 [bioreactor metagenome]|uniref:Uncharacterized protein n=1 Tax=bioreactor metagenome TaxID=1076179 RepID=A0A645HYU0_9ZZZZ
MKISTGPGIGGGTGGTDPVNRFLARRGHAYDGLRLVPASETRHLPARQLFVGNIRHIDIQEYGPLDRIIEIMLDQFAGNSTGSCKIQSVKTGHRHRNRRNAE